MYGQMSFLVLNPRVGRFTHSAAGLYQSKSFLLLPRAEAILGRVSRVEPVSRDGPREK